jgi:tetratricopeptide (TPR) repeat protein
MALTRLGELDAHEGNDERATARYRESLQIARDLGDQDIVAWTLTALGRVARHQGEEESAIQLFREALGRRSPWNRQRSSGSTVDRGRGAPGQPWRRRVSSGQRTVTRC